MPSSMQVVEAAGITYRQLDSWTRGNLLKPDVDPGIGRERIWSQSELEIAVMVKRLLDAGLTLQAAFSAARDLLTTGDLGSRTIRLAPNIALIVQR